MLLTPVIRKTAPHIGHLGKPHRVKRGGAKVYECERSGEVNLRDAAEDRGLTFFRAASRSEVETSRFNTREIGMRYLLHRQRKRAFLDVREGAVTQESSRREGKRRRSQRLSCEIGQLLQSTSESRTANPPDRRAKFLDIEKEASRTKRGRTDARRPAAPERGDRARKRIGIEGGKKGPALLMKEPALAVVFGAKKGGRKDEKGGGPDGTLASLPLRGCSAGYEAGLFGGPEKRFLPKLWRPCAWGGIACHFSFQPFGKKEGLLDPSRWRGAWEDLAL